MSNASQPVAARLKSIRVNEKLLNMFSEPLICVKLFRKIKYKTLCKICFGVRLCMCQSHICVYTEAILPLSHRFFQ
jgi:hypothetical protein